MIKALNQSATARLIFLIFSIDFFMSVMLIPTYKSVVIAHVVGKVDVSSMIVALSFAVITGSFVNVTVVAITAGVYALMVAVVGGKIDYFKTLSGVVIASIPLLFERVIRVGCFLFGKTRAITDDPLSFKHFLPIDWQQKLGIFSGITVWDIVSLTLIYIVIRNTSGLGNAVTSAVVLLVWGTELMLGLRLEQLQVFSP